MLSEAETLVYCGIQVHRSFASLRMTIGSCAVEIEEQTLANLEIHCTAGNNFLSGRRVLGHDHARGTGLGGRRRRSWHQVLT